MPPTYANGPHLLPPFEISARLGKGLRKMHPSSPMAQDYKGIPCCPFSQWEESTADVLSNWPVSPKPPPVLIWSCCIVSLSFSCFGALLQPNSNKGEAAAAVPGICSLPERLSPVACAPAPPVPWQGKGLIRGQGLKFQKQPGSELRRMHWQWCVSVSQG